MSIEIKFMTEINAQLILTKLTENTLQNLFSVPEVIFMYCYQFCFISFYCFLINLTFLFF